MGVRILHHNPERDALEAVYRTLQNLNRAEQACGLPPLSEQDLDRVAEIERRAHALTALAWSGSHGGRRGLLLTLAALCVAELVWLDRAELADPYSGEAA